MDLRSVLNTSDNGERAAKASAAPPPPPPQQQQHHHQQQQQHHHQQQQQQQQQQQHAHPQQHPPQHRGPPSGSPQYGYRDYPHHQPPHPSPGKPAGPDYQHHGGQYPPGAYPPPSPYQAQGAFPPRSSHPGSFADPRSPGSAPPVQSPYRHSAGSTPGAGPGPSPGYFQAQQAHEVRSPSQRHQYPPAQYQPPHHPQHQQQPQQQHQRHDSHPPPTATQPTTPYLAHNSIPQTPPVALPGAAGQQQAQQRTHSAQSTPTPTSAHSQHPPYGASFAQGSPAPQHQYPPGDYRRQPSQPPAPLNHSQSAGSQSASFSQPSSPHQRKMYSAGGPAVAQAHSSPNGPPQPQQQHRLSHPRPPSQPAHDSPESTKRRSMASDREHSMSVSPKTRVGSLPSNAEHNTEHRPSTSEGDSKTNPAAQPVKTEQSEQGLPAPAPTPAKRKLDDRSMSPSELEHRNSRPPPGDTNGQAEDASMKSATPTPAPPVLKVRSRHDEPPAWARSLRTLGKTLPQHANFVLQERVHAHTNGQKEAKEIKEAKEAKETPSQVRRQSTNDAPETPAQKTTNQPRSNSQAQPPPTEPAGPQEFLGPWEASITGVKPFEEISRAVADFLFIHVINASDAQEITSRGIEFEIEAKLGTLIDKDTNHRVERLVDSECVLRDTGRVAFQSSMTEAQHKAYNEFLNHMVIQTDPRAPNGKNRVQLQYKHRREVDKYFELPQDMQARIPGCVRARLTRKNVKARVTYDEKTGEVLNKIIKARVADIDLHMPRCPMDCRISINLEMNWDGPVEELEQLGATPTQGITDRRKDRLSYKQGLYQIDLTQVTMATGGGPQRSDKEHELEIEVSGPAVIEQGRRAMSGEPHGYQELVEGFIDNVRVLARKGKEFQ